MVSVAFHGTLVKALVERVNPLSVGWRKACGSVAGMRVERLPERFPNAFGGTVSEEYRGRHHSPTLTMSHFLTVNEAAKLTGKSPSSIRRILYPILKSDKHPDRQHIEPTVAVAKSLRVKGENFAWKISEELLRREIPEGAEKAKAEPKFGSVGGDQSPVIIEMLRKELDIKNRQIETQNDLLKGLTERLREGNILMGSLQQQLALTDGSSRNKSDAVDAESTTTEKPKPGSDVPTETPQKTHWLFRKIF